MGFQTPGIKYVGIHPGQNLTHTQYFASAVGTVKGYVFPNGARNAGAQWKIQNVTNWKNHQETRSNVTGPKVRIEYKQVTGWGKPNQHYMPIKQGQTTHTRDYSNSGGWYNSLAETGKSLNSSETENLTKNSLGYTKMSTTGNIKVDFDGDGKADIAAYNPETGAWMVYGKGVVAKLGGPDAWPVPGDYNGDKKTDAAVYYHETGVWEIAGLGKFTLGGVNEFPIPGDYNGDGKTDPAVYNPETGEVSYYFTEGKSMSRNSSKYSTGNDGYPFSGDFDGDGKDEFFCYDRAKGKWKQNGKKFINGGAEDDITVLADMDGDGKTDAIFFKPEQGLWVTRGKGKTIKFGQEGDIPIPADYNGDGKADIAVYRPSTSTIMIYGIGEYEFKGENLIPLAGGK